MKRSKLLWFIAMTVFCPNGGSVHADQASCQLPANIKEKGYKCDQVGDFGHWRVWPRSWLPDDGSPVFHDIRVSPGKLRAVPQSWWEQEEFVPEHEPGAPAVVPAPVENKSPHQIPARPINQSIKTTPPAAGKPLDVEQKNGLGPGEAEHSRQSTPAP